MVILWLLVWCWLLHLYTLFSISLELHSCTQKITWHTLQRADKNIRVVDEWLKSNWESKKILLIIFSHSGGGQWSLKRNGSLVVVESLRRMNCPPRQINYIKFRALARKRLKLTIQKRHIWVNGPENCGFVDFHKPSEFPELVHPLPGAGPHPNVDGYSVLISV